LSNKEQGERRTTPGVLAARVASGPSWYYAVWAEPSKQ
jgi:hypothetical protein